MRLTVVGCSGSFPGPDSAASCYLVRAEHEGRTWNLVLDLGSGALGPLQRHLDPRDIDAIVLSHLHPDHCLDVCGLYVFQKYHPGGRCAPIPVYGPKGSRKRLSTAYGGDDGKHLGAEFEFHTLHDREAFTVGPFTVTPFAVNHPVPAFGLRVEAGGRVLAYTGDTDVCPSLLPLMAGADLVLADSAFVQGRDDAPGIHLNGASAAETATEAGGVKRLMLTHMPVWNDPELCRAQARAHWEGDVDVAEAGRTYQL